MIYQTIVEAKKKGDKLFAVLIDPDKTTGDDLSKLIDLAVTASTDMFLVGGSLLVQNRLNDCIQCIKESCSIPVSLFPGSSLQLSDKADSIFLLSLISGRNPDLLIGQHVIAAPFLKQSGLEIIPTAYILIDGGVPTSVSYMSNTTPIPANKEDIALCTAMAGEMLGLKLIYLDAGSGARIPVSERMISSVSSAVNTPLIVGGGIRTPEKAYADARAGADVLVVGNALESSPALLLEVASAIHSCSPTKVN
ncbi:MAG: geranylgeranylglyceryl/heptaprenylglyceryl phosphate synthase [Saprospiraceae bacterium]|nr:geranylgeranylglyceryl/heptaprenylglyceryl phosphate synthase [Saprospiraceae bacterium]